MKHIPKYTPTEVLNDPYGFTYKEMSEVIGEDKAKALYTELYKQSPRKKNYFLFITFRKQALKTREYQKYKN